MHNHWGCTPQWNQNHLSNFPALPPGYQYKHEPDEIVFEEEEDWRVTFEVRYFIDNRGQKYFKEIARYYPKNLLDQQGVRPGRHTRYECTDSRYRGKVFPEAYCMHN